MIPFPFQIGGHHPLYHKYGVGDDGKKYNNNLVYKFRIEREEHFYLEAKKDHPEIYKHMPKYYGTFNDLIILEDLTFGMEEPCIVDFKIGFSLEDFRGTAEKRHRRQEKAFKSTSHILGYRISGIRWINSAGNEILIRKKDLDPINDPKILINEWIAAAAGGDGGTTTLIQKIIQKLKDLLNCLNAHLPMGAFLRSSSILLIYDERNLNNIVVKMIDFAHCDFKGGDGKDINYIDGISSLIELFQNIIITGYNV